MARLPRLALAGQAHLVLLAGHPGRPVARDDEDRRQFVAALREAALEQQVTVHAYALLDDQVWLLATPPEAAALGRWVQAIGRRFVAGFNRRHGSAGTLWAGRFRATVVQPGELLLQATLAVDLRPVRAGIVAAAEDYAWSSARHHLGVASDPVVGVGAAYWALGNTPFEREAAYARALDAGLTEAQWRRLDDATRKGWALGDAAFLAELGRAIDRPLAPRPRGRKGKTAA
jgi:putative transposase